jgi:hypothetical protein
VIQIFLQKGILCESNNQAVGISSGWVPRSASPIGNPGPTAAGFLILSITYLVSWIGKKPGSSHVAGPKIRTSDVQNNAGLRIKIGNRGAGPPAKLNFRNIAAIYCQYHCRSARHAYH